MVVGTGLKLKEGRGRVVVAQAGWLLSKRMSGTDGQTHLRVTTAAPTVATAKGGAAGVTEIVQNVFAFSRALFARARRPTAATHSSALARKALHRRSTLPHGLPGSLRRLSLRRLVESINVSLDLGLVLAPRRLYSRFLASSVGVQVRTA